MAYFKFITDEDFEEVIATVVTTATRASKKASDELSKNVLDPFAAMFSMAFNEIGLTEWQTLEKERQSQKSIQNAIGEFHQNLLGKFIGWENLGRGGSVDILCKDKRLIAEVKNKYNTMNSSAAAETYNKLANHLKYDRKGYTAYLVQVVPQTAKDYDTPWSPNHKTMALRDDIRRIDGESFYDLASGEHDTLQRIYERVPTVIAKLLQRPSFNTNILDDCRKIFTDVYK
jgi:hypothetical protein